MNILEKKHKATIVMEAGDQRSIRLLDAGEPGKKTPVDESKYPIDDTKANNEAPAQVQVITQIAKEIEEHNGNVKALQLRFHDLGDTFDIVLQYLIE